MDQRRIRRVIAAAALAMTLSLAPPAHAAGKRIEPGFLVKGWQWLTEIGSWSGGSQRAPAARQGARRESKRSAGIDPNGLQTAFSPSPFLSDGSASIDPQP